MKKNKQVRVTEQEKLMLEGFRNAGITPLEIVQSLKSYFLQKDNIKDSKPITTGDVTNMIRLAKVKKLQEELIEKFDWKNYFIDLHEQE
jgi:hypothetical protein